MDVIICRMDVTKNGSNKSSSPDPKEFVSKISAPVASKF